jgi:hypothetical protein
MSASTARHETRALLRAHLAAASGYRHVTGHCPICHRLLRLAMEPVAPPRLPYAAAGPCNALEVPDAPENSTEAGGEGADGGPAEGEGAHEGEGESEDADEGEGGGEGRGGGERPPPA